jgi:N-acetylglucosaminyldiphosphoundecaprenol N-acetyl-beta-D-mannosaminyltransferase
MGARSTQQVPWDRVELMEVAFDCCTRAQAVDFVADELGAGRGGWILTPNLHHMRTVTRDPQARAYVDAADLVVADGMPLVWASRLQGTPFPERVAGSDMVWDLSASLARNDRSVFVLGGAPGVATRAADVLRHRQPALRVAGIHSPSWGFTADEAELAQIRQAIADADPDLVLVGLPFPVQERLIQSLFATFPKTWFAGLGVSLSFVSGDVRRAPLWMQRIGLEWVHRLAQDPRRLARRYLIDGLPFLPRLAASALRNRGRTAHSARGAGAT